MTIAAILSGKGHDVVSVDAGASVGEATALLADKRIGALPVMDNGAVVGIFSERDVIGCLARHGTGALDRPVREAMTAPVHSVSSQQPVLAALSLMTARRFRHLPVIEDGRMIGFVSIGDLVKYRIEKIEGEAAALRDYIQQA